jgi:putative transposase
LTTNQSIRRGSVQSVSDLERQINGFVDNYNQHPKPFKWTATAESILAKLERISKAINGMPH